MGDPKTHILLVEDQESHAELVRRAFEPYNDRYYLTVVEGLEAARAYLSEGSRPDLIVADLLLPDGQGIELLPTERDHVPFPVIVMTSYGNEQVAVEAIKSGALDYVVKSPTSLAEMPRVAERVLREWGHITQRRRAEDELRKYREHLEELVQERTAKLTVINVQLEQEIAERKQAEEEIKRHAALLEEAIQELESFSYSVSHDLRAPLRAIDGFAQVLLEDYVDQLDAEGQRILCVISRNTQKMGRLIDDLLAFSRLGRREMGFSTLDMEALAKSAFEELQPAPSDHRLQFHVEKLPQAFGDRTMIGQVFVNLLSNAIKFTAPRDVAVVRVGGRVAGRENLYYVRDNGVGFDMRYVDKLFGVFQRLHRMEEFEGNGVGLALVQRVVQRHGGRVWAEAEVDAGATFYFTLPNPEERVK